MCLHTHPGTSVFELGLNGSRLRLLIFHKISPRTHHTICNKSLLRDRSLFIAWGGGEGSGAKQGEIWSDPPFECYFLIPPHNISWLSRSLPPPPPRPCLHFPSKFEWFPLWILPKFSAIHFGFLVSTDPPFYSPKNYYVIPPKKILPSPLPSQAIKNDRPLT